MVGTKAGGAKAAKRNKEKYGDDFYKNIGAKGGKNGYTGGFASDKVGADGLTGRERARKVGVIGGRKSKRRSKQKPEQQAEQAEQLFAGQKIPEGLGEKLRVDYARASKGRVARLWGAWGKKK